MMFLGERGYRVIAHDRRGHGRSDQTWHGNDMDTYAEDLAELIETLDLHDAVLVGHSTGGGEVARYIGRHGTGRVAKAVLLGAVPPLMLKSEANPDGTPIEVFDGIRAGVLSDRSQFFKDLTLPFYGYNREGAKISEGIRDSLWLRGMQAGIKSAYDCIKAVFRNRLTPLGIIIRRTDITYLCGSVLACDEQPSLVVCSHKLCYTRSDLKLRRSATCSLAQTREKRSAHFRRMIVCFERKRFLRCWGWRSRRCKPGDEWGNHRPSSGSDGRYDIGCPTCTN
jgi:hypothetical protein